MDDDPDSCELLILLLQDYQEVEVRAFASTKEALAAFPQFQPQVLISDLLMPDKTGFDLIQAVRAFPIQQGGKIPAIAISAMVTEQDRQRALAAGFDRFLTKPMDIDELISTLLDVLPEAR